ncbi:hypothetical protein ACJRO7_027955 [Eucalyptus globulus]|uniref:Uncharacterized protein n=1 Tax=Eucalyptus globulus TaxID=34317 RepID=A0ABD3JXV3_EUCGL
MIDRKAVDQQLGTQRRHNRDFSRLANIVTSTGQDSEAEQERTGCEQVQPDRARRGEPQHNGATQQRRIPGRKPAAERHATERLELCRRHPRLGQREAKTGASDPGGGARARGAQRDERASAFRRVKVMESIRRTRERTQFARATNGRRRRRFETGGKSRWTVALLRVLTTGPAEGKREMERRWGWGWGWGGAGSLSKRRVGRTTWRMKQKRKS